MINRSHTLLLVSASLMAFVSQACAERTFKGKTAQGSIRQSADAEEGTPNDPQDEEPIEQVQKPVLPEILIPVIDNPDPIESVEIEKDPDVIEANFLTQEKVKANYAFSLDTKQSSTHFTLTDLTESRSDTFNQLTRSPVTDMFRQGTPEKDASESFVQQGVQGVVDILVVIDDSGSMDLEQKNLATKMENLISSLTGTNWQIAVITTSPVLENNKFVCNKTLIRHTDADAKSRFKTAIEGAGLQGNGTEQGVLQAVVGLGCANSPWLRPNSTVGVVIVSDEDNCSNGNDCGTNAWGQPSYLVNYVKNDLGRTLGKNAQFYGIFSPPEKPCSTAHNTGHQYKALVNTFNDGKTRYGNICDESYGPTLSMISKDIALLLQSQFELNVAPKSGSLVLTEKLGSSTRQVPESDYTLAGNVVTFKAGKEPAHGSTLLASYRVPAQDFVSSFTLSAEAATDTVSVRVNGATLPADTFSVAGRTLSLNPVPEEMASVVVDYRVNTALSKGFPVTGEPIGNAISVKVNDQVQAQGVSYNAASKQIVFTDAPADGARIVVSYTHRQGPKLDYSLVVAQNAQNIQIKNGTQNVSFTRAGSVFTIPAAQHAAGRILTLSYTTPDNSVRSFTIPQSPVADTVVLSGGDANCQIGKGLILNGQQLDASCAVTTKTDFVLSYEYLRILNAFKLSGIPDPEVGTWEVLVNGQATTAYVREGQTIRLNQEPDLATHVLIRYTFPE